jgi:hypothetical protein
MYRHPSPLPASQCPLKRWCKTERKDTPRRRQIPCSRESRSEFLQCERRILQSLPKTSRFLLRSREPCRDLREFPCLSFLPATLSARFPIWMRPGARIYQAILFLTVGLGRLIWTSLQQAASPRGGTHNIPSLLPTFFSISSA